MNPRRLAALTAGRVAGVASRGLRRGGGTALTGLIAERIDPSLTSRLADQLGHGSLIVTGTNGKTTTARMLASIATQTGLTPLANGSGSNLMRGALTALIDASDGLGRIRKASTRMGIFEIDEATLPYAIAPLRPRVIVFTNLFRDQLDRYGEVDTVAARWRAAIAELPAESTIVLNADDPAVASLARDVPCRVLTYGIEDPSVATEQLEHASDYRLCLICGAELSYTAAFFGHVGHWRCPSCSNARPSPNVQATSVTFDGNQARVAVQHADRTITVALPLAGLYNVANALAAAAGAFALGVGTTAIVHALSSFTAAFGRQERFDVDGRSVIVLLAKNPTGMNQVLRLVAREPSPHVLLFLNDRIQDGRDISWIWDTDYELIAGTAKRVVISGTRAEELALRLKYADVVNEPELVHDPSQALSTALQRTPAGKTLYVVPTYTAMLTVRELLASRGKRSHYWEGV